MVILDKFRFRQKYSHILKYEGGKLCKVSTLETNFTTAYYVSILIKKQEDKKFIKTYQLTHIFEMQIQYTKQKKDNVLYVGITVKYLSEIKTLSKYLLCK